LLDLLIRSKIIER